jgi:hypothetical protein
MTEKPSAPKLAGMGRSPNEFRLQKSKISAHIPSKLLKAFRIESISAWDDLGTDLIEGNLKNVLTTGQVR